MIVIGDTPPQVGDEGRREALKERAARPFKSDEMRAAACFMAAVHERAIDYLEQAPVLAIMVRYGGGKLHGGLGGAEIYAAHKIAALCDRGARLRDVMAAYALALPMRQFKAKALSFADHAALRLVASLPPSVMAQAIPSSIAAQRKWLGALAAWLKLTRYVVHQDRYPPACGWIATETARHGVPAREIGTVADFLLKGDVPLNPLWTWQRALVAAADWHDRLSAGDAKKRFGVMADQVIDTGEHPDVEVVDGFEFVALRTPMAIHAEGSMMRHCVASYVNSVLNGRCSIISVRRNEARVATLELDRRGFLVAQLKGRFNTAPGGDVATAARHYAFEMRKRRQAAA